MDKLETGFGCVGERARVGAYAIPFSYFEALQDAQERGSRVLTLEERYIAIEVAESNRAKALKSGNVKELKKSEEILLDLVYGIKSNGIGYAGARDITSNFVDFNEGSLTEVDGISGKNLYGRKGYYKWLPELERKTRELQDKGLVAHIQEIDPVTRMVVKVGEEPNPQYHGAIFWISPDVKDFGVITAGQHHSVGEPCAKYDIMILPPDYKDIMLGARTVSETERAHANNRERSRLAEILTAAGVGVAMIYEIVDRVNRDRISLKDATEKVASYLEKSQGKGNRLSRRHWLQTAASLIGLAAASCGGESPPQPPLPPEQKFEYSGSVAKRIANNGSKIILGEVILEGTPGTFRGSIDSVGNFRINKDGNGNPINGVPAGIYRRTTRDNNDNSIFVPQVESVVVISGNLVGQNYSVIERGDNRFGVRFDNNFQVLYSHMAQREHQSIPGMIRWGNGTGEQPRRFVVVENTVPPESKDRYMNLFRQVASEDPQKMSDGRIPGLQVEFGTAGDYDIEDLFHDGPTITDYPVLSGRRIVRARTRNNSTIFGFNDLGLQFVKSHDDVGHGLGYADFNNDFFDSVMSNTPGRTTVRPVAADYVVGACAYSVNVSPGSRAPDTNP